MSERPAFESGCFGALGVLACLFVVFVVIPMLVIGGCVAFAYITPHAPDPPAARQPAQPERPAHR